MPVPEEVREAMARAIWPSDRMLIDALCIVFASNHYVLTSREAAIVHRAREIISFYGRDALFRERKE